MLFNMSLIEVLIVLPILILSLSFNEYAHAFVSTILGDPTPGNARRLTLNPLAHLDPFGTIMLVIAGFGWARPVPIDISYYKRRNLGLVLTSLAGPAANLLITIIILLIFRILFLFPVGGSRFVVFLVGILQQAAFINIALFVFNMFPIPPLDGSRLVTAALRNRPDLAVPYNQYGGFLLLGLIIISRMTGLNLLPISQIAGWVYSGLAGLIFPA